ncbi:glycosyltransferase family 2 protein [Segetibacter koreensis]|uniref:glycosyltransferase family 2 protein n=1 Tax=Segetibacter koreensis TaxID=398037 RepID=UPI0003767B01|nr:glycosyltransferase family 2 protein [Segetibacter koreensis]
MNDGLNPTVSVITSFLNEERFLEEAMNSVLNQRYTKWELILVDDGSSDNSTTLAKNYAASYPRRIFYLDHENHGNKGLSASRNYGVSKAKGSLIGILDADDVWLPDKLQLQVDLMNAYPEIAMLCEASQYWYSWADKSDEDIIIEVGKEQDKVFYPPSLLKILYPLSENPAPCPSGIMIRTDKFRQYGGFEEHFRGKYQLYEDQAFLHKMYLNEPVYLSSLCNNRYRQREGSLVQKIKHEGNYEVVRKYFLEWLEDYLNKNNLQSTELLQLLNKALKPYRHPYKYKLQKIFSQIHQVSKRL